MSFYRVLRIAALLLASVLFVPFVAQASGKRPVVVELFTSQGCSSCPPADALLGQLAARKDVIALSLPITYWDMLGWKDTLASDACTRRQKSYAQTMGRGGVYTPEMVIDGVNDVVGNKDAQINAAIGAREADEQTVPVSLTADRRTVHIAIAADSHADNNATIWLFRVLPFSKVAIGAGENSGHTFSYRNSVQSIRAIGIWKGEPVTLDLPRDDLVGKSGDSIAVVVQQGGYGRIVGAAMMTNRDTVSLP